MFAVDLTVMGNLAQFDLKPAGGEEARTRALLEDLTEYHTGVYEKNHLALAVWYGKTPQSQEQNLLELFSGLPKQGMAQSRFSLHWKAQTETPPFVNLKATSVEYFLELLKGDPEQVAPYQKGYEVIFFDKKLLSRDILEAFNIITEPSGLIKGWYVTESEYAKSNGSQHLLSLYAHAKWNLGLVKTTESSDFENCRGVLQVEVGQKWRPFSADGIRSYSFYNDLQSGRAVYFLFEGGSLYQVLKFEVRTAPEYADILLETTPDNRYPEVYLRAVHPPAKPAP